MTQILSIIILLFGLFLFVFCVLGWVDLFKIIFNKIKGRKGDEDDNHFVE